MKDFGKMMEKKKDDGKGLDPAYKDAKMKMLEALRSEMSQMMSGELKDHGMKKVEVASDSQEGLAHGLDKAKDLLADHDSNSDQLGQDEADEHNVGSHNEEFGVDPDMEEDAEEGDSSEPEHEGEQDLSDDDIAHLEKMLADAKSKKMRG